MSFFGILINILFKFIFTCNPLLSYHNIEWEAAILDFGYQNRRKSEVLAGQLVGITF